ARPVVKKYATAKPAGVNTVSDQEDGAVESDTPPEHPLKPKAAKNKMELKFAPESEPASLAEPITLDGLSTLTVKRLPSKCQVSTEGMDEELADVYKDLPNLV
ncbi:hypothetical protein DXG01_000739, partial [Tephrocybe rancida]